jgi:hypothetical protein
MTTKKYWCPMCGDVPATPTMGIALLVTHKADCIGFHAIPVVEPLDVPEVTTWGESGGAEAVTCRNAGWSTMTTVFHDEGRRWAYHEDGQWAIAGSDVGADAGRVCCDVPDVVDAINYVAGSKR